MRVVTALAALMLAGPLAAQEPPADPADVGSVEAIMAATYASISGPAGPRQWDRFRSLFAPEGRMIPTGCNRNTGACGATVLTVDDYIERAGAFFDANPFFEVEAHSIVERYGLIAHVFSTYESRRDPADAEPFVRGINTFQLRYDGTRWWIVSIMWVDENSAGPIPERYLP